MTTALDPATPVIHASLGDNLAFERCLDAGMNDQVTKPFDPARLIATVERWTRGRRARRWNVRSVPHREGVELHLLHE